eukprot:2324078-Prymnesium_polylepis.1
MEEGTERRTSREGGGGACRVVARMLRLAGCVLSEVCARALVRSCAVHRRALRAEQRARRDGRAAQRRLAAPVYALLERIGP